MVRLNKNGGEKKNKKMNMIKNAIKTEVVNGVNYTVIDVRFDAKDCINGKPCERFVLPAIKEGDCKNSDGYFQLFLLEYVISDGKVRCNNVRTSNDDGRVWFYDDEKDEFLVYDPAMTASEHVSRTAFASNGTLSNVVTGEVTCDTYDRQEWKTGTSQGDATETKNDRG